MKIEAVYQESLKKLIKEKPLDEINVVMLCDDCKSNRQTFYYHFRDISDVVESIFLKAKVGYAKKLLDYEAILKEIQANGFCQYTMSRNMSIIGDADKILCGLVCNDVDNAGDGIRAIER